MGPFHVLISWMLSCEICLPEVRHAAGIPRVRPISLSCIYHNDIHRRHHVFVMYSNVPFQVGTYIWKMKLTNQLEAPSVPLLIIAFLKWTSSFASSLDIPSGRLVFITLLSGKGCLVTCCSGLKYWNWAPFIYGRASSGSHGDLNEMWSVKYYSMPN